MNVAIVGSNSQVGTELAFLYRSDGHDVTPIVRSDRSSWFLAHHGFDCAITDVTVAGAAKTVLKNADLVVVAAFASQFNRRGFRPKSARHTNEQLIRHSVQFSPPSATVAYLSTIHAFGRTVGPSRWTAYGVEKRNAETTLLNAAANTPTEAYPLRLGQVFGLNQGKTEKLIGPMARGEFDAVATDPNRESNLVHTVTVKDATYLLADRSPEQHTYTVVNQPQWTWQEVYDYHLPSAIDVNFSPPTTSEKSLPGRILEGAIELTRPYRSVLRNALLYTPEFLNVRLAQRSRLSTVGDRIAEIERGDVFHTHEFDYDSPPGPELTGLTETRALLEEYKPHRDTFAPSVATW